MVELVGRLTRAVTILPIEHDMAVALELAERVTGPPLWLGHRRRFTEAARRDPRVMEIYLGANDA